MRLVTVADRPGFSFLPVKHRHTVLGVRHRCFALASLPRPLASASRL